MNSVAGPFLEQVEEGMALPGREFKPDSIQLFLYNAVLWNAHKIHFDEPYAREVEGYPGLVVPGPLLGDWLNQIVVEWLGDNGQLVSIEYSNRNAAYVDETLHSTARIVSIDRDNAELTIEVAILNQNQEVVTPGTAIAKLFQAD